MDLTDLYNASKWQEDLANGRCALGEDISNDTGVSSITVQVVLLHPGHDSMVYWVLNKQEPTCMIRDYPAPKPRGWGNPGGGVEPVDALDLSGRIRSFQEMVCAGARREVRDETGFPHFQFQPYGEPPLCYVHLSGHQVITLAGCLRDFVQMPIEEVEEIEDGAWFDLAQSPVDLFQHHEDLPYLSHVRRTIIVLNRLAQQNGKHLPYIHPLWKLVFSVGAEDPRFPLFGYSMQRDEWREEMRLLIKEKATQINLDRIWEAHKHEIEMKQAMERSFAPPVLDIIQGETRRFHSSTEAKGMPTQEDLRRLKEHKARITRANQEQEWQAFFALP